MRIYLLIIALFFLLSCEQNRYLKVPALVSDNLVLQQNTENKIWGWATPGKNVKVVFSDTIYSGMADESGVWSIKTKKYKASTDPLDIKIKSGKEELTIKNVLFGDVWICSGQSNMELPIRRVMPLYKDEVDVYNTNVRYFEIPKTYNFKSPQNDISGGQWQEVTPANLQSFSAVAYFFANELYENYHIPIGLINASLGGSPIESWMSEEALKQFPSSYDEMQRFKNDDLINEISETDKKNSDEWYSELHNSDIGLQVETPWFSEECERSSWEPFTVPGYWNDKLSKRTTGVGWFYKEVEIPDSLAGKAAFLNLGRIVDSDQAYINGKQVGTTGYQYPPRWYDVPEGIIKAGKNQIVVRIVGEGGNGGFVADKIYQLEIGDFKLNLEGEWLWKLSAELKPKKGSTFIQWKPGGLYNAMIAPLLDVSHSGVIWYQGESNISRAEEYYSLFPAMINSWRSVWNQGDFPFLFVQLANLNEACQLPCESGMAQLRDAQSSVLSLPNTAMAVAYDVGEWNDIHPLNKKDVGIRLALGARKIVYDENITHSGPVVKDYKVSSNKVYISFENCDGLKYKGEKLGGFAIAGEDGKFVWASAEIVKNQVIVYAKNIKNPKIVRYAWADNPDNANLYNGSDLPALPFSINLK